MASESALVFSKHPKLRSALLDLRDGLLSARIWWRLAVLTVREQHKRSVLGPLWNTVGVLVIVLLFGLLYGSMMGYESRSHLAYVAAGYVLWMFYSDVVIRSGTVFATHGVFIQQMSLPKSVYILRMVAAEFISFMYAFIVVVVPSLLWADLLSWRVFLAFAGFVLILVNVISISMLVAVVALRYRDVAPMVGHIMRPLLFVTPIIWTADKFPERAFFIDWNPFYHMVEIFRAPLLGKEASIESYAVVFGFTAFTLFLSLFIFIRYRSRIAYWV